MIEVLSNVLSLNGMIVGGFLLINLLIGIYFSGGITDVKEYAIGKRNFSTAVISYTIIATWISGDIFTIVTYNTYSQGLYFIILTVASGLSFYIISYFIVPRMQPFIGKLSIAEVLGDIYGNSVKGLSAFAGIVYSLGTIAAQFSVLILILNDIFNIAIPYIILSCIIIILYSTMGGIKSVTFTDIIQCFTFCLVIPITTFFIWESLDQGSNAVFSTLEAAPIFTFQLTKSKLFAALWPFLLWLIPCMDPALCQRIFMSKNIKQSMKSFSIAAVILVISYALMNIIGILLLSSSYNELPANNVEYNILTYYLPANFKGFFVVGIMAMAMSTADSYINTASLLSNDIRKALGIKVSKTKELFMVRVIALFIGIFCLIISLYLKNFMQSLIAFTNFYLSIVTVPIMLSIFGFRSSSKSVLMGMITGLVVISVIELFTNIEFGGFAAMIANFIILIGSHYLLSQPGGWGAIVDDGTFLEIQKERRQKRSNFLEGLKLVNYITRTDIKLESIYVFFGGIVIISHFFNLFSLQKILVIQNELLINVLSYLLLSLSTILISFPVWQGKFNNKLFRNSIFYILIIALIYESYIFMLINNFESLQIVIFTLSVLSAAILLRWQAACMVIASGIIFAIFFYKHYTSANIEFSSIAVEATMFYIALMICLISLVFLKPKADALAFFETKSHNLWQKVNYMDKEVRRANNIKTEFINNINHEVRTPMTGITSLSQVLWDNYDKVPESKRRECVYTIAKNSERLISLMNNILDISSLTSLKMKPHLKKTNMTDLVYESLKRCKNLYLEDKDLRFKLDIENDIYAECDGHYIEHTIDNLIINAISYSRPETAIKITLKQHEGGITYFAVRDEGVGIPKEELSSIFKPFTTSTKTHSTAGGRGIGLALCYAAILAHKGKIWAESDGANWAEFSFEI